MISINQSNIPYEQIADKFITYFSEDRDGICTNNEWKESLTDTDKNMLLKELVQYEEEEKPFGFRGLNPNNFADTGFYLITSAKHHDIWGHRDFPDLVFKRMSKADAEEQYQTAKKAHNFAIGQNTFWCKTPFAQIIQSPDLDIALYAEEKLPIGMNYEGHRQFLDRVFVHLSSSDCTPIFKENLAKLVRQMCDFIENTGFWDVGLGKNFPEISLDGTGVCVTDFEKISDEEVNPEGIKRLAGIFCFSPCIEYITERYEAVALEKDIEFYQYWNKQWGVIKSDEEIRSELMERFHSNARNSYSHLQSRLESYSKV